VKADDLDGGYHDPEDVNPHRGKARFHSVAPLLPVSLIWVALVGFRQDCQVVGSRACCSSPGAVVLQHHRRRSTAGG
jgi:hypothetical protein